MAEGWGLVTGLSDEVGVGRLNLGTNEPNSGYSKSGRKPAQESCATEFRHRLVLWKQTPGSSRPSLRALACELGTSHQLLAFYLKGLENWRINENWRLAKEIRARAKAEGRPLSQWEEHQARDYDRAGIRATVASHLHETIEQIRQEAERGPLSWYDVKA